MENVLFIIATTFFQKGDVFMEVGWPTLKLCFRRPLDYAQLQ